MNVESSRGKAALLFFQGEENFRQALADINNELEHLEETQMKVSLIQIFTKFEYREQLAFARFSWVSQSFWRVFLCRSLLTDLDEDLFSLEEQNLNIAYDTRFSTYIGYFAMKHCSPVSTGGSLTALEVFLQEARAKTLGMVQAFSWFEGFLRDYTVLNKHMNERTNNRRKGKKPKTV